MRKNFGTITLNPLGLPAPAAPSSYPSGTSALDIITGELERYGGSQKYAGDTLMVCCPFHDETHPSFGIYMNEGQPIPLGYGHCLAAETLVITSQGIFPIHKLVGQTTQVIDGNGHWTKVEFRCYGTQKLYQIDLTRNRKHKTVFATSGHRWLVKQRTDDKTTVELKSGDWLEGNSFTAVSWQVVSVTPTHRVEPVYCCEVPTTQSFVLADNLLTGNCLGCGVKGGWNFFALQAGLEPIKFWQTQERKISDLATEELEQALLGVEEPCTMENLTKTLGRPALLPWPVTQSWRGFEGNLIARVGGLLMNDNRDVLKLLFPVQVKNKVVGGIKANFEPSSDPTVPNYIMSRGTWVKKQGLFPYDYTAALMQRRGETTVVLVEGARDALRLLLHRIPALAVLGSKNFGTEKAQLVCTIVPGLTTVVTFGDNDKAGRAFNELVTEHCSNSMVAVLPATYPRWCATDTDPGNMPFYYLHRLQTKLARLAQPS